MDKQDKPYSMSEIYGIGILLSKIEFWSNQYEFSFQFWGEGQNNVFINRDDVEIASFGGRESVEEILKDTVAWCEKANPRKKYPSRLTISNIQP